MAESESGQDKTEDPTEKRKKDSREKGEIARSKELNTVATMMAGAGALLIYGGGLALDLMELMKHNFTLPRDVLLNPGSMGQYLLHSGKIAILAVQPILITLLLAALIGPVALGGWLFAAGSMAPKFSRMNPAAGLKRMFSAKALVELLKALAKFILILFVALMVLSSDIDDLLRIAHEPLESAIIHSVQVVGWSALWMAAGLIIIADVVITNPTHYAVALKYDPEKGGAPMLLAKGSDFTALKIREIAVAHDILLLESPELARSIFYSTDLDQEIPAGLYLAVAQVLAYVYQIRQYRAGKGKRPDPLKDLPIPPELRRDS